MSHNAPLRSRRFGPAAPRARGPQSGLALVVSLILLVVITLLGLAAVGTTTVQQKLSANFYDRELAFQSAEAALRVAETVITASPTPTTAPIYDCSAAGGNVCLDNPFHDTNVPTADIQSVSTSAFNAGAILGNNQPQYVVEYLGNFPLPNAARNPRQLSNSFGYDNAPPPPTANFYRITVRSGPANVGDRASVMLQTLFRG